MKATDTETLQALLETTKGHDAARKLESIRLDSRDHAIADAVRAGARLDEIAEAAAITRAAASLAARRSLAPRPGRGGPYSRRRAVRRALDAVTQTARDLVEAREQSRCSKDRRDEAIAIVVANGAGVSHTARAVGLTPASVSVIARSSGEGQATDATGGAVASRKR